MGLQGKLAVQEREHTPTSMPFSRGSFLSCTRLVTAGEDRGGMEGEGGLMPCWCWQGKAAQSPSGAAEV